MNDREWRDREFLLPALRSARGNFRLVADEIDAMGIMLKAGGITIQDAINWMDGLGVTGYVGELTVRLLAQGDEDDAVIDELDGEANSV